jgi:hypothetical protein
VPNYKSKNAVEKLGRTFDLDKLGTSMIYEVMLQVKFIILSFMFPEFFFFSFIIQSMIIKIGRAI